MAVHWTARARPFCKYSLSQPFVFLASLVEALAATDRRRSTPKKSNIKNEKNYEEKNKEEKP